MYQGILSHIAFFFTLFKGYKCNKFYEITAKKRFLCMGTPENKFQFSQELREHGKIVVRKISFVKSEAFEVRFLGLP